MKRFLSFPSHINIVTIIKDCKEIELNIVANNPMVNVCNNIDVVLRYVDIKFKSLEKGTSEF